MNFLAHFHLAWPDDALLAGGLEGDYHKGAINTGLAPGIQQGIRLHRAIDAYTDAHPTLTALRSEFGGGLRRYAGILVDVSFDHFLSRHWSHFADRPLAEFNSAVYRGLHANRDELSAPARRMLDRLVQYDLLGRYADWHSVPASAARIGERFSRGNPFVDIDDELQRLRPSLEAAFLAFYPQLQAFAADQRESMADTDAAQAAIAFAGKNP